MSESPQNDLLRLDCCPACGYRLEGLPGEGVCPECGAPYDQSETVLHGYGAGRYASVATARPRTAVLIIILTALLLTWWLRGVVRRGVFDIGATGWVAVVAASTAWALWKRSRSDMPGLVQVRLSARGAVQVNNPTAGGVKAREPTPWSDLTDVQINSVGADRLRITLTGRRSFWRGTPVVVDAEVECNASRGHALVERVKSWRAAGAGAGEKTAAST